MARNYFWFSSWFSSVFCTIYSYLLITVILQIMQETIKLMPMKAQHVKLLNPWENALVICLHGLKIKE